MKNSRLLSALTILLALSLFGLEKSYGATKVDETRSVDADAEISIDVLAGDVTITAWDKNEVRVTGTLDSKAEGFEIEGDESDMSFQVKYPDNNRNLDGSTLEFMVPKGCELQVQGVSTDFDISRIEGSLEAETVSGDIRLDCKSKDVEIGCVSGDVKVTGVQESLEISIVSGDARVTAGTLKKLEFSSVSGDFELEADAAKHASWEISCHSGTAHLVVPSNIDAEFEISTFSGDIDNEFGQKAERTSKFAPGKELNFTNGSGSARIEISVFSGEVRLEKK